VRALKDTGARIAAPLAEAGPDTLCQHIDRLDTGALVDLFRGEENACLLGTDALPMGWTCRPLSQAGGVRQGALAQARHPAQGAAGEVGKGYDDLITRFR